MMRIPCQAADYYFSAAGSDSAGDGSLASPWKSVAKFNSLDLNPGDNAYFRSGDSFAGRLYLDEADAGTDVDGRLIAPVRIASYGGVAPGQRARILAPANGEGVLAYNNGGLEIADLEIVAGAYSGGDRKSGVSFYTDRSALPNAGRYQHLRVSNVVAHGFAGSGLSVYANDRVGYDGVEVVDSEFYDNGFAGVVVHAGRWQELIHANVLIDRVVARDNPGYVGAGPHAGHGVVVSQIDGAVVQHSVARDNGKANGYGNVGIWTWQANNVVIQGNLAYGNRSPRGGDGGAFDLDGGVTNSLVQFNRSYDNDGAGLLLAQFAGAGPMSHNVFRYNVSINDGRDQYGGITIWGASASDVAQSAVFHNNTIVIDGDKAPNARGPVWFLGEHHGSVDLFNNLFVALNGTNLIAGDSSTALSSFIGNAYWTGGEPISLGGINYSSVEEWASLTGHETANGSFAGVASDPRLVDYLDGRPLPFSPLANAASTPGGAPWPDWIASLGSRDFDGTTLPQDGAADVGAYEIVLADFNFDGCVDDADLALIRQALGGDAQLQRRFDLNGDERVDGAEILVWQRRLSMKDPIVADQVPESDAAALVTEAAILRALSRRPTKHRPGSSPPWPPTADEASTAVPQEQ